MRFLSFLKHFLVIVIPVSLIAALIYFLLIRPWILHMGATSSEANMSMPGDNLVNSPNCKYTQAVTIKAPKKFFFVRWTYMLKEVDKDTTRLYVRWESNLGDSFIIKAMNLLITEPGGAGIQQSQNLRGIKSRAEKDYSKIKNNYK